MRTLPAKPNTTEMRYLYHLSEGNKGPVTFEQLQALAQAGTIDNMTPVLAEGASEWSRWLFIKNAPQGATAPAPAPKKEAPAPVAALNRPTAKPEPKQQTKQEAPKATPAPAGKPAEVKTAPKVEAKAAAPTEPRATHAPAPKPEILPAPEEPEQKVRRAISSFSAFTADLNLMQLIPAGICAGVTLLSLLAAGIWTFMAHDTRTQYAELRAMAAEHEQKRADLESLQAQQQQVADEKEKLAAEITSLQHTLQLTLEESARLAKGPYISEAEDKQLKEEQFKAAKLKEQERKL